MTSFADLARTLSVAPDTRGKRARIDVACPTGCGGTLTIKDFSDGPLIMQHGDCTREKIGAAIEKPKPSTERKKQEAPPEDESPPVEAYETRALPARRKSSHHQTDDVLRRLPPENVEAEQSVLGAVFLENECLSRVKTVLAREDFYREIHREIFRAMEELASKGVPIDAITMTQHLRTKDLLEQCGGAPYIITMVETVPTSANVLYYARIVRDMAIKRNVATIASDLASMAYDGVNADSLVGEFQRIAGSLDTVKRNAVQDIFGAGIQPLTGKDLVRRAKANPGNRAVCDGFLYRKQVSMWAGKVEAGKTTLLRELSMDVIRGDAFLGRACVPGRVTYLMLDADGEDLTFEEFQKMGWNPEEEDNLEFIFDPIFAQKPRALDQFHQYLIDRQPSLVVIDPLARFIKADDFNAYGMTYVMAIISEMAKSTDCHFAVPQHIPRGRNDDADAATAAFGSIAIGGSVNARFVCTHKPGNIYTLKTSRGKGAGFVPLEEELILTRNEQTGRISAAGAYSWKDQAKALMDQVLKLIESTDELMTAGDLAGRLGVMRSAAGSAAQMLYAEKRPEYRKIDREGKGKPNSPFKFKKLIQNSLPNGDVPND